MIAKYRKKPAVVEAFRYDGDMVDENGAAYVPNWAFLTLGDGAIYYENDELYIKTLDGDRRVTVGDYIVQGVAGKLYPCKPDIFAKTYEATEVTE